MVSLSVEHTEVMKNLFPLREHMEPYQICLITLKFIYAPPKAIIPTWKHLLSFVAASHRNVLSPAMVKKFFHIRVRLSDNRFAHQESK